jgi:mono/diheme cytochrome c family protein
MRKPLTFITVVLAVVALAASVAAQSPPRPSAPPTIVVVNAHPTTSIDGATLFQAYCSSCHGTAGRGDGPAARALSAPVPDLTRYSRTHNGDCLRSVLAELQTGHRNPTEAKVSEKDLDMPNWAPIFTSISRDRTMGYLRLSNVARHVATIQAQ